MEIYKKFSAYIDSISMYRIMYCTLAILAVVSVVLAMLGKLSYGISPVSLGIHFAILSFVSIGIHILFQKLYNAPANIESTYITLFVLFFVAKPPSTLIEAGWVALLAFTAVAGKYVVSWNNRAMFNPAALALVVLGILGAPIALWWVGSPIMFAPVLIAALVIAKKLRRFSMILTYLAISLSITLGLSVFHNYGVIDAIRSFFLSGPAVYFAGFMLTEPLTAPGTRKARIIYAALIAVLGSLTVRLGNYGMTPELALCIGNLFGFLVGMHSRVSLTLKERIVVANNTEEFVFAPSHYIPFRAGQYVEWTLPQEKFDNRGMRRYFTVASAPSENVIRLGTKFVPDVGKGSTFKNALHNMEVGAKMWVTALGGDFTLPKENVPVVFIAGGIGVTPFASMLRQMLAEGNKEKREVTVFYANRKEGDIAYRDLFDEATKNLGIRVIHILSDADAGWEGEVGFVTEALLKRYLPSLLAPTFYLSGPSAMVDNYKGMLKGAGVHSSHIKTDYFPGLA